MIFDQFGRFLENAMNAVYENAQKEEVEYDEHGAGPLTYQPVMRDYEAIQLQQPEGGVSNFMEVVAFLVEHKAGFTVCRKGHIHTHIDDELEQVLDGEWVVSTQYEDGHEEVDVYSTKDFRSEFSRKFTPSVKDQRGADLDDNAWNDGRD